MSNQARISLPTWLNMKPVLIDRIVALARELGNPEFSTLFRPFLRWQQRNDPNTHQQADYRRVNPNREVSRTRESSAMSVPVVSERRPETRRVPIPSASNRESEALGIAARAPNHSRTGRGISDVPHAGGIVHRNTSRQISSRAPGGIRDDAVSSVTARLSVPFLRASPSTPPSTPPFSSGNRGFLMSPHLHPDLNRPVAGSLVPRSPEQILERVPYSSRRAGYPENNQRPHTQKTQFQPPVYSSPCSQVQVSVHSQC